VEKHSFNGINIFMMSWSLLDIVIDNKKNQNKKQCEFCTVDTVIHVYILPLPSSNEDFYDKKNIT
jgi:hypothetical protein